MQSRTLPLRLKRRKRVKTIVLRMLRGRLHWPRSARVAYESACRVETTIAHTGCSVGEECAKTRCLTVRSGIPRSFPDGFRIQLTVRRLAHRRNNREL